MKQIPKALASWTQRLQHLVMAQINPRDSHADAYSDSKLLPHKGLQVSGAVFKHAANLVSS
jgi:hypothetical protein